MLKLSPKEVMKFKRVQREKYEMQKNEAFRILEQKKLKEKLPTGKNLGSCDPVVMVHQGMDFSDVTVAPLDAITCSYGPRTWTVSTTMYYTSQ